MSSLLVDVRATLEVQHSLITRRQVLTTGHSPNQIHRLLRLGVWEVIDTGLYGPVGVPMTWKRRLMAAVLLAPAGSMASHRAAAAQHGVGGLDDPPIEISIPRGSSFRRPGVVVHESTDLALARAVLIDGIPTTDLRRLAVDIGAVVSPSRFTHTIREIRHGHAVTSEQLLHTYLQHKIQGRNGCGVLRDWIDRYFDVNGVPESGIELVVLDALLDLDLPTPEAQFWVETPTGRYRLDIAYPERLICVEVDGRQHEDAHIAAADEVRTATLKALGWHVIRIRSDHLASDLSAAIRQIRHLHTKSVVDS